MSGKKIGYIRVSTTDQNTARQLCDIALDKVFKEHASAGTRNRPVLASCLEYLRDGDILICHSMDRLARNVRDLLDILNECKQKQVSVQFIKEGITFTGKPDPFQDLQIQIIASVAQFERAIITARVREGCAIAKAQGKFKGCGRKKILSAEQEQVIYEKYCSSRSVKIADLAREYGISRGTVYNIIKAKSGKDQEKEAA